MQQFAEIVVGMTPEQVLALVPDPLPPGRVAIAVPDPFGGFDKTRGGMFTDCEFDVTEGETRGDFAERVLMSCCDWVYDVNSPNEPPPSPEYLRQLGETAEFQALFKNQFEEDVHRGLPQVDLYFAKPVHFTFEPAITRHVKGQFTGEVERIGEGIVGETSGLFRIALADGAHPAPAAQALADATLYLKIHRFPGLS